MGASFPVWLLILFIEHPAFAPNTACVLSSEDVRLVAPLPKPAASCTPYFRKEVVDRNLM